ncbi:MAG: riboflavin biosynthesis protein RibF [Candidatus Aureabacteria bacterium]|nr:riboflavin biosynthesis protein RibF [Candidatus Auribacterota bacterium]
MMKVVRGIDDGALHAAGSVALTIGVYDGVHLGHRRVIEVLHSLARRDNSATALLTFEPHPRQVTRGQSAPRLTSIEHRLRLLDRCGLDFCLVVPFDAALAAEPAESFIARLATAMRLRRICVGPGFVFGRRREGDSALLEGMGARYGFAVEAVPRVEVDGAPVSSTAIRHMVRHGDLERAARFLGRPYSLFGAVVPGKGRGGMLGAPTANLDVDGELLPPQGVYAARVLRSERSYDGVLNIGGGGEVEAHLFEFSGTLYGERLEAIMGGKLREERSFPDDEALARQIRCDIAIAKEMLHNGASGNSSVCGMDAR